MIVKRIKWALLLAGALLAISAIANQILDEKVAMILILGLSGLFFIVLSFAGYGKKQIACEINFFRENPLKALSLFLGVLVIFGGIGLLLGKLLYHIMH